MSPSVSILIPTFNRSELLMETLESVINQTYENWECIIVDDNSTDKTRTIIKSFLAKDLRFQYFFGPDHEISGANACRNFAFRKSKGDFIQYLDDDDLLDSNKIEAQVKALSDVGSNTLATAKWDFFNEKPGDIKSQSLCVYQNFDEVEKFIDALAISHAFMPPHAYLIPRNLIHRAGEWNEKLMINQDGEFMSRIFTKIEKVVFDSKAKVYYRIHSGPRTSILDDNLKMKQAEYSWDLIEANFILRFGKSTRLVQISRKYLSQNLLKMDNSRFRLKIFDRIFDFFKRSIKRR